MKYYLAFLIITISSCGGGVSEYSEDLTMNYTYVNEGEGGNHLLSDSKNVPNLAFSKKYSFSSNFICVWQADSLLITDPKPKEPFKRNTYYPSDRFYIIDIKKDTLLEPYENDDFFRNAKELNIKVDWQPVVPSDQ